MAIQGVFGVLNGSASLLFSSALHKNMEVMQIDSIPALQSIALGSVSIGAFYLNAAYRNDRPVMWASVIGRWLSIPVFLQHGGPWKNVAIFEGVCGVSIAIALFFESKKIIGKSVKAS